VREGRKEKIGDQKRGDKWEILLHARGEKTTRPHPTSRKKGLGGFPSSGGDPRRFYQRKEEKRTTARRLRKLGGECYIENKKGENLPLNKK